MGRKNGGKIMNKVKMRKSVMKDFKRKAYMLLQKDWKQMKLSEKMRVIFVIAPYPPAEM